MGGEIGGCVDPLIQFDGEEGAHIGLIYGWVSYV